MIVSLLWSLVAAIVSRPRVAAWLISRSQRTPYYDITSRDGSTTYMRRWWLFNAYGKDGAGETVPARWSWLPSIRVHHILRADDDAHLHDHPWDARTVILRGWYCEERPTSDVSALDALDHAIAATNLPGLESRTVLYRGTGYTGPVDVGAFHRISRVSDGGVYTMFFTWGKSQSWHFKVGDRLVPWREYLGVDE